MTGGSSRYTVLKPLGEGGVGEVFLAEDALLRRRVALKFMRRTDDFDGSAQKWLLQEARTAAAIDHPYICKIYEVAEAEGRPFIVMEHIEGETLHARLRQVRLTRPEALRIILETSEALVAAEAHRIVHRDLKPANIMLTRDGHVKVMDFGLAKRFVEPDGGSGPLTWHGNVGTLNYMSPEQIRGEAVDARSDIFCLGIVAFESLSGIHPFERPSPIETAGAIVNEDAPPLSECTAGARHPDLPEIIARMLNKSPDGRYQSAADLRSDLLGILDAADRATTITLSRWGQSASAQSQTSTGRTSIIVMPTRVIGKDADQFLADAIPNALSKLLLKLPQFDTKRPPTSGHLERVSGDLDRIAAIYGAATYVMSTIVLDGERITLSVQLVETASRTLLWSDDFEGARGSYGLCVKAAVHGIQHTLQPQVADAIPSDAYDVTSEAELLFQRGLYHLNLFRNLGRPGDFERAAAALEASIHQQPDRADGPIGMALLHNARIVTGAPAHEVVPECERWVRRAMAINPRSSKSWAILGEIETIRRPEQIRKPIEYGLKAAAYGPRDGFAYTRLAGCFMMHSYELALIAAREGARLDPLGLDAEVYAAISLNALNRVDEALATIRHVLEIEPDMVFGRLVYAMILADAGLSTEAREILVTLEPMAAAGRLLPQWPAIFRDVAAYRDALRDGDAATLQLLTARLASLARGQDPFPRWQVTTQGITRLIAATTPDLALDLFAARALMGIIEPYDYLVAHPELNPLRADVRFHHLLATSHRNFEEVTAIISSLQRNNEVPRCIADALDELTRRFDPAESH